MFEDRDGSKTNNDLTLVGRGLFVRTVYVRIHGIGMIVKTTSREESEGVCIHTLLLQRVHIYMDWETTSREECEGNDCFLESAGSFSPGVDSLLLLLHHPTSLRYLTLH